MGKGLGGGGRTRGGGDVLVAKRLVTAGRSRQIYTKLTHTLDVSEKISQADTGSTG